jgi:alpha-L-rhamnosidase
MRISTVILFLFTFLYIGCKGQKNHTATGLMTDLLLTPEMAVITNPEPRFSWLIEDNRQGGRQTAWQIMVATTKEKAKNGNPDMWDSGKTMSGSSVSIPYGGKPLEPFTAYWWRVRTWDQDDSPGKWSEIQRFNNGEFDPADLKWPGESRWVRIGTDNDTLHVLENRHHLRYEEVAPVSVTKNDAGNHFVKFEKAAFGTLKLSTGTWMPAAGDSLIIHLGEKSAGNGAVDRVPGGSITYKRVTLPLEPGRSEYLLELPRQYSNYPNSQVLAEHMPEVAAFRYAEIEGWKGGMDNGQVRQYALLYHFDDDASAFSSTDGNLNLIWDLCKHTLKVTPFLGLYIDGTRERMPYEADAYIQQISHYAVDREFAIQRYTNAFLIYNPSWPTEWHLHIVLMAWADYMATGDERFLREYYQELKKKTLLELAREDGLISSRTGLVTEEFLRSIHYEGASFRDIVDWPQGTPANEEPQPGWFASARVEGETDRFVFSDINTVVNAFHYRNLVLMEKIASVLGKVEEAVFFRERASLVRDSFNDKLLDRVTGLYRDGEGVDHSSLHANMFPVAFGLAPEENFPRLREFFISKGMACSPYGAPYLFDALYKVGAEEFALELLTSEGTRSWMNMINFGTTITSEAWDIRYKNNMTWNHAWGASPAYIITRHIFGIEPLEPGFGRIQIRPRTGALESARIVSPSIRGSVHVKFERIIAGGKSADDNRSRDAGGNREGSGWRAGDEPAADGRRAGSGRNAKGRRIADFGSNAEDSRNAPQSEGFTMEIVIPANTSAVVKLPAPGTAKFDFRLNGEELPAEIVDGLIIIDHLEAGNHNLELNYSPD